MKKLLAILLLVAITQTVDGAVTINRNFTFSSATAGASVAQAGLAISHHSLVWTITGGTLSACQIKVQKSANGTTWTDLIATQTCTSAGITDITEGAAAYVRVNVTSFTIASGTPRVNANYLGFIDVTIDTMTGFGAITQIPFFDSVSTLRSDASFVYDLADEELRVSNITLPHPVGIGSNIIRIESNQNVPVGEFGKIDFVNYFGAVPYITASIRTNMANSQASGGVISFWTQAVDTDGLKRVFTWGENGSLLTGEGVDDGNMNGAGSIGIPNAQGIFFRNVEDTNMLLMCAGGTDNWIQCGSQSGGGPSPSSALGMLISPNGPLGIQANTHFTAAAYLGWVPGGDARIAAGTEDVRLYREAAGVLGLHVPGANPQTFAVYENYTSSTAYRRLRFSGNTGGAFQIYAESAGGESARGLDIFTAGAGDLRVGTTGALGWLNQQSTQAWLPGANNDRDIGNASARVRNVFVGNAINIATVTVSAGSGAPAGACVTGSFYGRTDGGAATSFYVCESLSWVAK